MSVPATKFVRLYNIGGKTGALSGDIFIAPALYVDVKPEDVSNAISHAKEYRIDYMRMADYYLCNIFICLPES
jgi:hypothetical protein